MTGTIPSEISIPNLQFIDLSNNQLEGQIPSSIGKILNLQGLNLSNNKFSGNVPSSFHSLKNIQSLYLSGNSQLSGELPNLSKTLNECSFDSTTLCINDTRNHCTNGLKTCESLNNDQKQEEPTPTKTEDNSSTTSTSSSVASSTLTESKPSLGPEDFNKNKHSKNDNIIKWIGLAFVILLVLCILILILICCKRRYKKPVVIDKPVPGHSTSEIFEEEYVQSYDGSEDPDASIQIHSLSRPQQVVVPVHDEISHSQTSSYDESSQYESISGKSNNFGQIHYYSYGRSPANSHSTINQGGAYSTNSLNRTYMPGTPVDSLEQDLGDIVITNGSIVSDNSHMVATTSMGSPPPKRIPTNISSYSKSQSSPNLVRMNRYSVSQPSTSNGTGKRRLTNVSTHTGTYNESPKLASASSSPSIDAKRSKHSSIPYPISPFAMKSSTINTNQRKTYDTKRLSSSNDEAIHHNTVHVVNSRKSIPYNIEKSPTTTTTYSNSIHSSTPIMSKNKNRTSLPPMNTKKPSIITKFSSQNSMNVSPLANNMDNNDMPSASDSNDQYRVNNNKTSINPSTTSTNTSSLNDNSKVNTISNNNNNVSHIQDNSYNSEDNDQHQLNTSVDTNTSSNQSSIYNTTIKDTSAQINNNINMETYENPIEEVHVEESENDEIHNGKASSMASEDYKQYDQEIYNEDYEYENIPEDLRQQIEEPQPPNYEEVFSESMYAPYVDPNNDEAIRMQLEMRRIEERQTRMEYLQRQIDNPELTNAQRQKYIDALDRLMLE